LQGELSDSNPAQFNVEVAHVGQANERIDPRLFIEEIGKTGVTVWSMSRHVMYWRASPLAIRSTRS
jgi:hypothetical protein